MFDWFYKTPKILPTYTEPDTTWTTKETSLSNFSLDKLVITATTDGAVKIDFNGTFALTIPPSGRHEFLEKIQKAINMADIADPDNEPLTKVLK